MTQQQAISTLKLMLVLYVWREAINDNNALPSPPALAEQHPNIYIFETDQNGDPQSLILPCRIVNPSPTINYTWFRGDQELPGSMVNGEGSLIVPNITEGEYASREGVDYYCIARDNISFDVAIRSRSITVYYAYFSGFERMAELDESTVVVPIPVALNSAVALECDVLDANPPPKIKWFNDQGEIREITEGNRVRFLDNGRYLYLKRVQATHLQRQYYCNVINANLTREISAPTRYVLMDNLTQGILVDYKQIGNLIAFVGTTIEFTFVGGIYGDAVNETINVLTVDGIEVAILGNIGIMRRISTPGIFYLEARIAYNGLMAIRNGTLTIYEVPRITNTIQDHRDYLVGGQNLTYICQFEGFPLPNISFYHNGAAISRGSGVTIIGNTLIIPTPQVSHSGVYQCIISNVVGDDQLAWLLEVREPIKPQVKRYNYSELHVFDDRNLGTLIIINSSSTVSWSVDVIADPCPRVVWNFNGTILSPNDSNISYNNPCLEGTSASLNIWTYTLNVVLTSDTSGHYSADFTNVAGTTFLPRTYFTIPEPVSITGLSLNETCLKEGSSISIRCNIRGFPRPTIEFHKNGDKITPEVGIFSNIFLEFYDQITIKNATVMDEGLYSCIVSTTTSILDQTTKMFDYCTVPSIIGVDITPNPSVEEPFFIECAAEGIPAPNTAWVKDGVPLEDGRNLRIVAIPARKSSRLEVSNANIDFNGEYQCIVSNIAGSVRHSFMIELMLHTQAPLGLIIGVSAGGTLLITVALCILIVLVCVMCRIRVRDKGIKPQSANTYSANVAYLERLRSDNELVVDPLYDIIPYSDPSEVHTKGGQAHEMERIHKRAHVYDKIIYEDAHQPSSSVLQDTSAVKNATKNISKDDSQMLENNHKYNSKCSHDESDGKKKQKINKQEANSNLESDKGIKPKHLCSDIESEAISKALGGTIVETMEAGVPSEKGDHDNDEPSQVYASISAEFKAKKRIKMLKKQQEYQELPGAANQTIMEERQQREDQKESGSQFEREMEEIMESGKLKKEASEKMEAKKECNATGRGQADRSKEDDCQCQNTGSDEG